MLDACDNPHLPPEGVPVVPGWLATDENEEPHFPLVVSYRCPHCKYIHYGYRYGLNDHFPGCGIHGASEFTPGGPVFLRSPEPGEDIGPSPEVDDDEHVAPPDDTDDLYPMPPESSRISFAWHRRADDRRQAWRCKSLRAVGVVAMEITPRIEWDREGEDVGQAMRRLDPITGTWDHIWRRLIDTAGRDGLLACLQDDEKTYAGTIIARLPEGAPLSGDTTVELCLGDTPIGTIRIHTTGRFRTSGRWRRFGGAALDYLAVSEWDKAAVTVSLPDGIRVTEWLETALKGGSDYGLGYTMHTEVAPEIQAPKRTANWTQMLAGADSKRNPLANVANAIIAFRYAPQFEGVLRWNEFTGTVEIAAPPPWRAPGGPFKPHALEDVEFTRAQEWIQFFIPLMAKAHVADAILAVARDDAYHPVRDYLDDLKWDGVPRIDTWLIDHLGAEDTPLHRAFGAKALIGAVARAMQPGCKLDTMLILEGPQGILKSQALRVLGEPWFVDYMPDIGSKDAMIQLQGAWIIEQAELHALKRADVDALKRFMSTQIDIFRPPYGRATVKHPRQCAFFGTVNPGGTGYLKDETGDRRYWPVACGVNWQPGQRVDITKLRQVKDQMWAEARVRFERGEAWWLDSRELEDAAAVATDARYDADAWTAKVLGWADGRASVTTEEILGGPLGLSVGDWTKAVQMRVGGILRQAGWTRKRDSGSGRAMRYHSPNPPAPKDIIVPIRSEKDGAGNSAGVRGPLAGLMD